MREFELERNKCKSLTPCYLKLTEVRYAIIITIDSPTGHALTDACTPNTYYDSCYQYDKVMSKRFPKSTIRTGQPLPASGGT